MGLLDVFGKKDVGKALVGGTPYSLTVSFNPYRLDASKKGNVDMTIGLKNLQEEGLLTSVVVRVPERLGLDQTGLTTAREIRLGYVAPKEEKALRVEIMATHKTTAGEFPIEVTAYCHYRDYAHVLNSVRKRVSLRVV